MDLSQGTSFEKWYTDTALRALLAHGQERQRKAFLRRRQLAGNSPQPTTCGQLSAAAVSLEDDGRPDLLTEERFCDEGRKSEQQREWRGLEPGEA